MKLSANEEIDLRQQLEELCGEVDIDRHNGAIRVMIADNRIEVSPNKFGELELRSDELCIKDLEQSKRLSKVMDILNGYLQRKQFFVSNSEKLVANLKYEDLGVGNVIVLCSPWAVTPSELNLFQIGKIAISGREPQLTITCLDNGITFATGSRIDDLIKSLIEYLKAHPNIEIPENVYKKCKSLSDYIKQVAEEY